MVWAVPWWHWPGKAVIYTGIYVLRKVIYMKYYVAIYATLDLTKPQVNTLCIRI